MNISLVNPLVKKHVKIVLTAKMAGVDLPCAAGRVAVLRLAAFSFCKSAFA